MNKNVKFVLKCIIASSPAIILIGFTLLFPLCYMDNEYPAWRYSKNIISGKEGEEYYETLILGDSGAMSSFVPSELSDSCVNIAVGGGTSIDMYYFLKEYLENHSAPKNVVVMFAPFHYTTIDNYDTRTMYFKALSVADAYDLYKTEKENNLNVLRTDDVFWQEFACRMGLPTKYLPAITKAKFVGRLSDNKRRYQALAENDGYGQFGTSDGCDGLSYECSRTGIDFNDSLTLISIYLYRLNALCQLNDIDMYVMQQAMNEASMEAIDQNYLSTYYVYTDTLERQGVYKVFEKELRTYPNEYFGDVSHLNAEGAIIFSNEMKSTYRELFNGK